MTDADVCLIGAGAGGSVAACTPSSKPIRSNVADGAREIARAAQAFKRPRRVGIHAGCKFHESRPLRFRALTAGRWGFESRSPRHELEVHRVRVALTMLGGSVVFERGLRTWIADWHLGLR